ncbi:hypothetical protein MNBD_GAMMA04-136 [hydrothermal vent metagenome]|uniref:Uncharacterized protein n=1 Tax=hydrothermal vent metagenome TaxID=652676 RepID=A0A3B0WND6_9ZZZZ
MNNLAKSIASLLILPPVMAFSATEDDSLSSYLKDYHPESYITAQKIGMDINALEFKEPNINNIDSMTFSKRHLDEKNPRKYCEKSGGIFLENNFIATCVSEDGTFGNGSQPLGITFNPSGTGTINAPDYLRPGTPFEYFSVRFNNQLFTNNNSNGGNTSFDDIPATSISRLNRHSTIQEGGVLVKSTINHQNSQLDITQKYTVDPNSREIIVRVEMKNTGYRTLKNVTYARGLDPDQNRPNTFKTVNRKGHTYYYPSPGQSVRVDPNNIAWASGKKGLSVALYSVDPVGHNTCISSTWTTDPINILNQDCGLPQQPIHNPPMYSFDYSDSTINIAFKLGSLKPQETRVFSFKYLFNQERPRIIGPIPIKPLPIKLPKLISIR